MKEEGDETETKNNLSLILPVFALVTTWYLFVGIEWEGKSTSLDGKSYNTINDRSLDGNNDTWIDTSSEKIINPFLMLWSIDYSLIAITTKESLINLQYE